MIFWVAAVFLLPVSPIWPPRRPFLPYGRPNLALAGLLVCYILVHDKYLRKHWTNLDQIFRVGRTMGADDKSDIRFAVSKGRWHGYQLRFGAKIYLTDNTFTLCTGVSK